MGTSARIAFAKMELEGIFGAESSIFLDALRASWRPGASVVRYGRKWHLTKPYESSETVWTGRIGFVKEGELQTLSWDDEADDFQEGEASSGVVVPFAFDLTNRHIAFQLFAGQVRPQTFTGALQSLLNEQSTYTWRLLPLSRSMPFDKWIAEVRRITYFSFLLKLPNPTWEGREDIEAIVTQLEVETLRLRGRAKSNESVNAEADIFRQSLDHVQRGYGSGIVVGLDDNEEESEWHSTEGGSVPARGTIEIEENRPVEPSDLIEPLHDLGTQDLRPIEAVEADEEGA